MITAEEARKLVKESKKDNYEILLDYICEDITKQAKDGYEETAFTISNGLFYLGPGHMLFFDDYKNVLNTLEKELKEKGFEMTNYVINQEKEEAALKQLFFSVSPTVYVIIKWKSFDK